MNNSVTIRFILLLLFPWWVQLVSAQQMIVVSKEGKADFKTIQGAINSLKDTASNARIIFIKKGVYNEKIYIEKHNIILMGEDRDSTIITAAVARDEWRCGHNDDWGVATINVEANDITLKNLTITNSYGFSAAAEKIIYCPADTVTHQKKVTKNGHQMALRTMAATRFKAINCYFNAYGGDTVSPWTVEDGMFYFKDCILKGGVDFYCPRGWAWAENCEFIAYNGPACIWHDGSKHEDSKSVLMNCRFKGYDGFMLGRYHRDAQFFLVNCVFAANMKDQPIYRVPAGNTIQWGERIYYFNCHREAGRDFGWYRNNLPSGIDVNNITVNWVFGKRWNPTKE
jgi:pectinesterase